MDTLVLLRRRNKIPTEGDTKYEAESEGKTIQILSHLGIHPIYKYKTRAGEMAQWVRAPTALPKVMSSNPSNHMVAHNHPKRDLRPSNGVSEDSDSVLTYIL